MRLEVGSLIIANKSTKNFFIFFFTIKTLKTIPQSFTPKVNCPVIISKWLQMYRKIILLFSTLKAKFLKILKECNIILKNIER